MVTVPARELGCALGSPRLYLCLGGWQALALTIMHLRRQKPTGRRPILGLGLGRARPDAHGGPRVVLALPPLPRGGQSNKRRVIGEKIL